VKKGVFLLLLLLAGCGYTLVDSTAARYTVTVPFIEKDNGGELTRSLIRELSQSANFSPSKSGRYTLEVVFVEKKDENVGFRYDQNSNGELINTVIPCETRTSLLAQITLIDSYSNCRYFGPVCISAGVTYDHDWYTSHGAVNVFSLGQVTDYFDARDSIYPVLSRKLAKKIVDMLDQI